MFGFRRFVFAAAAALGVLGAASSATPARAQASDPYLGQLMLVGFSYCPRGWTDAAGQILAISSNQALFALYGTTFGGNGQTTFALPDLRSRIPIGQGQGPGLSPYVMGQLGGGETVTLNQAQMPAHTHPAQTFVNATSTEGNATDPSNALLAAGQRIYAGGQADARLSQNATTTTIGVAGSSQPFSVLNPYLGMRWCVALQGVFPSRN